MNATAFDVPPNYEMLSALNVPIYDGGGYPLDERASRALEEAISHFLRPEVMEALERYRLTLSAYIGRDTTLLCALDAMAEPFSNHPSLLHAAARSIQAEAELEAILTAA